MDPAAADAALEQLAGGDASGADRSPVEAPTPEPAPAEAAPEPVTLTRSEFDAMTARLAALEGKAADADRVRSDWQQAEARRADREAVVDRRHRESTIDRDLLATLSEHPLIPGVATDLALILRGGVEAAEVDGAIVVRPRGAKATLAEHVDGVIRSGKYDHFLRASGGPGSGASGTNRPGHPTFAEPVTAEARIIAQWKARERQIEDSPGYSPGVGLKPIS